MSHYTYKIVVENKEYMFYNAIKEVVIMIQMQYEMKTSKPADYSVKRNCDTHDTNSKTNFNTFFFEKKRCVVVERMDAKDIEKNAVRINNCKMVVFDLGGKEINLLIEKLLLLGNLCQHYSPIVQVEERQLFFFPQLNYGDVYLLKEMFKKQFKNQNVIVILGKNTL